MGNILNTHQKFYTPDRKDVACQVEFFTREGIKRSCNDETYIIERKSQSANKCTKCNILLDNGQEKKAILLCDRLKPTNNKTCGNCRINLDGDIKVILEPCKHILCVLCYRTIYWEGRHFSLSSAVLQNCYQCKNRLLCISTDINDRSENIKIRHSLCNLNDYVTFHHKNKALQFADLPQINVPYHLVSGSKYFPLDTPQPVQNDIIAYISIVEGTF